MVASIACDADAPESATNLQVTGGVVNGYGDVTLKKWHGDALLIIGSLSLLHLLSRCYEKELFEGGFKIVYYLLGDNVRIE